MDRINTHTQSIMRRHYRKQTVNSLTAPIPPQPIQPKRLVRLSPPPSSPPLSASILVPMPQPAPPAPPAHLLPPQVTIRRCGLFCQITHAQRISNHQPPASQVRARGLLVSGRPSLAPPTAVIHLFLLSLCDFQSEGPSPAPRTSLSFTDYIGAHL